MSTAVVPSFPSSKAQQENRLKSRKVSKQSGLKPLRRQTGIDLINSLVHNILIVEHKTTTEDDIANYSSYPSLLVMCLLIVSTVIDFSI